MKHAKRHLAAALRLSLAMVCTACSPGAAESLYFVWFVFLDWMASLITWNAQGPLAQAAAALQSLLLSWTFGQLEGVLTRELLAHSWLVGLGWLAVTSSVGVWVFRRRELR